MAVAASRTDDRAKTTRASLDSLQALVADDLAKVDVVIVENMHSPVPLIPTLAGHIVASGGKRLRPMLTLISARLAGYRGDRHVNLAACVEFIHTATLLHDDVVDVSEMRRGRATANALWGSKPSVLVGDFLFSRAFELMVADGSLKVLQILSNASAVITEGEVMQLVTANNTATTETDYLNVITAKTGALFAAACRVGAVVAEREEAAENALLDYGLNLGIAFQLVDDALDYAANQATLGKTVGDDFREGKITLPVVLAFQRGSDEERRFWRRTLEDGNHRDGDLAHAIALIERHGAIDEALDRARGYGARAADALDIFPDGPEKNALLDVVAFSIGRAY